MEKSQQEEFVGRIKEVLAFAKEKGVGISATQQVNKENGYIETVPVFKNLMLDVPEVKEEKTGEVPAEL